MYQYDPDNPDMWARFHKQDTGAVTMTIKRLRFDYINHEGEEEERLINPIRMFFGSKLPWYPEPTWLLSAYDINRLALRDFQVIKMRNIREE